MKKLVFTLACILALSSCASILRDDHLAHKISEIKDQPLVLKDLTDYPWDSVYIAGPYVGFSQLPIQKIPLSMRIHCFNEWVPEFETLLMFKSEGRLVKYAFIPVPTYDFSYYPHALVPSDTLCATICIDELTSFYTSYITNILGDSNKNKALCREYMSDAMLDKVDRLAKATGADPIIRVQDMTEDALATLHLESIHPTWYKVSYLSDKTDSTSLISIAVKAQKIHDKCQITYITPSSNGIAAHLTSPPQSIQRTPRPIKQDSAEVFVSSFYRAYTRLYAFMPATLHQQLADMRASHLSAKALKQFTQAEAEHLQDGQSGYDLLIKQFDYDYMWLIPQRCTPAGENDFVWSYATGDVKHEITVSVKKIGDRYVIDGIAD